MELRFPGRPAILMASMVRVSISLIALTAAQVAFARPSFPVYNRAGLPNIQAEAAAVVDLATDEELVVKNADAVRPIASISKLMAILVVLEHHLDLDGQT